MLEGESEQPRYKEIKNPQSVIGRLYRVLGTEGFPGLEEILTEINGKLTPGRGGIFLKPGDLKNQLDELRREVAESQDKRGQAVIYLGDSGMSSLIVAADLRGEPRVDITRLTGPVKEQWATLVAEYDREKTGAGEKKKTFGVY